MVDTDPGALHPRAHRRPIPRVTASPGLVVEVASAAFVGEVVACTARYVELRDRRGRTRRFSRTPGGFFVDDERVELTPPAPTGGVGPPDSPSDMAAAVTNSGSIAIDAPARTARAGRILVEGIHDAELVELVWGDDLRAEGVVVEVLDGADDLVDVVRAFGPAPQRRLGVLLDHLLDGTKESRLAAAAADPHVLVTGHPFVDVWAAVRPEAVGITAWPDVPRGEPWKQGVAARLGFADTHEVWRRIRTGVRTWRDLDQTLIRAVEELIDFVTEE